MKKKLLLLSLALLFAFSTGMVAASTVKWNGFDTLKLYVSGKEVKATEPPIVVKGKAFVPVSALKKAGISLTNDGKIIKIETPKARIVYKLTDMQLEELSKAAYMITTSPTDGHPNGKQGTAFIVDGYMITMNHVAGDASYVRVQVDGSTQKVTSYDFVNSKTDVMGWKVQGGESLPYSTELPEPGDAIYDVAYPGGKLTITEGQVYSAYAINGITRIAHSAKTEPGASGGLLLNGRGEIIGANKSGDVASTGDNISIAIAISHVLDEIKNK